MSGTVVAQAKLTPITTALVNSTGGQPPVEISTIIREVVFAATRFTSTLNSEYWCKKVLSQAGTYNLSLEQLIDNINLFFD